MKQFILTIVAMMFSMCLFAQKDVTTFLGIPVDGTKQQMKQKLISKGFVPKINGTEEYFVGEFNGTNVHVYIVTNNNKVYRIMVCDANTIDEANIKIRFNRLVSQFENNKRYMSLSDSESQMLSDDVDISYQMALNKIIEAVFYQKPNVETMDTDGLQKNFETEFLKKYTKEQLDNPTEEIKHEMVEYITKKTLDVLMKKTVWFRIQRHYGEYFISMFYDNEYNKANGDDL